ncbi:MAG: type II toxin-antitoxin system Phd/YefM family antitoxin [Rhodocyclaceae bacterium]|nr:type II toxin-antitoxin system Phd/YefM family antitoxin [Rhodocyclaceae bacterium]
MRTWQLQEAKSRMSELVRSAQDEPQEITLHGRPVAVVVSTARFSALSGQAESLVDFMNRSPLCGAEDVVFEREQDLAREIDL